MVVLVVWGILVFYLATALQEGYLQYSGAYEPYKTESAEVGQ
jgi:hypothetical protein